jgi:hypothetical protein
MSLLEQALGRRPKENVDLFDHDTETNKGYYYTKSVRLVVDSPRKVRRTRFSLQSLYENHMF